MNSTPRVTQESIVEIASAQWLALDGDPSRLNVDTHGAGLFAGPFGVGQLGAAAFATVGAAVAELLATAGFRAPRVSVDIGQASALLGMPAPSIPDGWPRPSPWSDVSRDYPTIDGRWVRLQANYPHLRRAVAVALETEETPEAIGAAIERLDADSAERLIVEGGGAAAATRTIGEWARHPQGAAVASEPLIDIEPGDPVDEPWRPHPERPLSGLRVLDVTRVLAGPTATRFLAGLGAEVLRIDPRGYAEPGGGSGGELMLGKRCAHLELDTDEGRRRFLRLLAGADILVHGLRAGALDALGLGAEARAAARPGLIEVTLNAYGWTGPWATRRGFDTLVQASAGYSTAMMGHVGSPEPRLLPAQVLDIATGYLMAAAAVRGLTKRLAEGGGSTWRLSLARTARHLLPQEAATGETGPPAIPAVEDRVFWSPGGPVRRLTMPVTLAGIPIFWERPGDPYGSATPDWVGHHLRTS